jgi:hypothetical protein
MGKFAAEREAGSRPSGKKHNRATVTDDQARQIIDLLAAGKARQELAKSRLAGSAHPADRDFFLSKSFAGYPQLANHFHLRPATMWRMVLGPTPNLFASSALDRLAFRSQRISRT